MNIVMKKKIKEKVLDMLTDEEIDIDDIEKIELSAEDFRRGLKEGSVLPDLSCAFYDVGPFGIRRQRTPYIITLYGKEILVTQEEE